MTLNPRELATVLAALRAWRSWLPTSRDHEFYAIATDGGRLEPLHGEEIAALCDRLAVVSEVGQAGTAETITTLALERIVDAGMHVLLQDGRSTHVADCPPCVAHTALVAIGAADA